MSLALNTSKRFFSRSSEGFSRYEIPPASHVRRSPKLDKAFLNIFGGTPDQMKQWLLTGRTTLLAIRENFTRSGVDRGVLKIEQDVMAQAARDPQYIGNILKRLESNIQVPPKDRNYIGSRVKKYHVVEERIGQDHFQILTPNNGVRLKTKEVVESMQLVWSNLRGPGPEQVVTIMHFDKEDPSKIGLASMENNPVIWLYKNSTRRDAVHEAVHAVLGAESGHPRSMDFVEGCSVYLSGYLLDPNNVKPDSHYSSSATVLAARNAERGTPVRSHTALLDEREIMFSPEYAFGFYMVKALHQGAKGYFFERIQKSTRANGLRAFVELNRLFTEESERLAQTNSANNRLIATRVFCQRLGFTPQDVNVLFEWSQFYMKEDANPYQFQVERLKVKLKKIFK